ncbi:MAG: hypothetical protein V4671_11605, partial [Armatimonadota bacterium]
IGKRFERFEREQMSDGGDRGDGGERSQWEAREIVAEFRAMPLRTITAVERDTKRAVLDCGHTRPLLLWLRPGETMPCRPCFAALMQKAQAMIERNCG